MLDSNKAVVRSFIEALGQGDSATLGEVMSKDIQAVCTGTSLMAMTRSYDDIVNTAGQLKMMIPDGIQFTILAITAEEDRVSAEVEGRSTLATGQAYNNQYHFLFYIRDGKVFRLKEYMDSLLVENLLGPLVHAAA